MKMKKIFMLVMVIAIAISTGMDAHADERNDKKQERAEKKRLEALNDSLEWAVAKNALENSHFAVLVDRVEIGMRDVSQELSGNTTNFVFLVDDKGMIQVATNSGYSGFNGMGGITVEGVVGKRDYKVDKKGVVRLKYYLNGAQVSAQVNISLEKNVNFATVLISPNYSSDRITMYGKVVPYGDDNGSTLFKGTETLM